MNTYHPLPDFLDLVVPFLICELKRRGGPTDRPSESAKAFSDVLAEKGDILLYRSNKRGESSRVFNQAARAIAVGAFLPGGITIFGKHYECLQKPHA